MTAHTNLNITPIAAFSDNYIWLVDDGKNAVCIDPGDAAPLTDYLHEHNLNLQAVLVTHHHHDHIGGVAELLQIKPQLAVYGVADIACVNHVVAEGDIVSLLNAAWRGWSIPGHTHNHLAYLMHAEHDDRLHVFCGDTVFSAGCGRVFCGTIEDLQHSVNRLAALPDDTLLYPAHEYTASNLRFALSLLPDDADLQDAFIQAAHTPTLPVSVAHEKRINPFLRLNNKSLVAAVVAAGFSVRTPLQIFAALRQMKNDFRG